eukprot:TRINITY_DN5045_c0_g1_i1.p1 TRINITY_DN5045_c0_g1~~TRINITY_DN5045_c0_g1_i1.p1  ORF type:complete len:660 (-),score=178.51 TRINITY_DN5045_c0_g1_i1:684-2486(-)
MVQRRCDDPSKRRSVRRTQVQPAAAPAAAAVELKAAASGAGGSNNWFDGMVLHFVRRPTQALAAEIEARGGLLCRTLTMRVTHVICDECEALGSSTLLENALVQGATIVRREYIEKCLAAHKRLDEREFRTQLKRKAADGESDRPKKKAKLDAAPAPAPAAAKPLQPTFDWQWLSDDGWELYSKQLCVKLEKAREGGVKQVKVDEERYVDLDEMAQCRYSDPSKQRKVKREPAKLPPPPPAGVVMKVKHVKKGRAVVDPVFFARDRNWHVLEEGENVYDATLNQTNVLKNNNKFYILQLLEADACRNYTVWTRWGRVGAPGQTKSIDFEKDIDGAKQLFYKRYHEKTLNDWLDRQSSRPIPGKYRPVETDYRSDSEEEEEKKIKGPESTLDPRLQTLVSFIYDVHQMNNVLKELEIDTLRMPLGRLSQKQIRLGYEILKKIEQVVTRPGPGRDAQLVDQSNQFYTLIPHNFGMKRPVMINNLMLIKQKMALLETLADMEIAGKLVKVQVGEQKENILDVHYRNLRTKLAPIVDSSDEWKFINDYVHNSHAPTHDQYALQILDIFEVHREGEAERYEKCDNQNIIKNKLTKKVKELEWKLW